MANHISKIKSQTNFPSFDALDIRVGTIIKVEDAETKKATYRITVDFGAEIGTKVSCGAYRNYTPEHLVGKQIIAIINFAVKQMGPEKSEVLILGVPGSTSETVYLTPESTVANGVVVF